MNTAVHVMYCIFSIKPLYLILDTALKEYLASLPAKRLQKSKRSSRRRHRRQSSVPKVLAKLKLFFL